jgi:hypothetical protein
MLIAQLKRRINMTQLTTIDTNNYAAMAKAMGIANENQTGHHLVRLARLRINHHLSWVLPKLMANQLMEG